MCAQEHVARQTTKTPSGSQNHGSHRCLGQQTTRVLAASLPRRHKDPHTDATTAPTALTQLGLSSHVPYLNARLSPIRIARVVSAGLMDLLSVPSVNARLLDCSRQPRREGKSSTAHRTAGGEWGFGELGGKAIRACTAPPPLATSPDGHLGGRGNGNNTVITKGVTTEAK